MLAVDMYHGYLLASALHSHTLSKKIGEKTWFLYVWFVSLSALLGDDRA
jgi:hypothetical protein